MNSHRLLSSFRLAAVLAIVGGFQDAHAQSAREPLTEQQAVTQLVEHNPGLHSALLQASQAEVLVSAEEGLYSPVLSANAGYTRSRTPYLTGLSGTAVRPSEVVNLGVGLTKPFASGTRLSLDLGAQRTLGTSTTQVPGTTTTGMVTATPVTVLTTSRSYSVTGQLTVTQPLLRGAYNEIGLATLRQARLRRNASVLAAHDTASRSLRDVITAYWELWYAERAVAINQASRDFAREQERTAREQALSGALAQIDALVYSTRLAELEEAVVAALTQRRARAQALGLLMGDPERAESWTAADPPPGERDAPRDASQAVKAAFENSPELRGYETQIAIARDARRIAGDALRPRLDLDAYVQAQGLGNGSVPPALEQFGKLQALSAHVGLTFEMPLDDARRKAQVQNAEIETRLTQSDLVAARQRLQSTVLTTLADMESAQQRLRLAIDTQAIAQRQAEAERQRFRAGASIALQVQQAENSLLQAELRLERARVDLIESQVDMDHLTARLLPRFASVLRSLPQAPAKLDNQAQTPL
ncbi:MAG TPA: TolC family protein [Polyangiaceae bacterium]|nr:TolC family protein [Polyangiaceae bacterium]